MKVFAKGYDDKPTAEFDLGKYGFVEFTVDGEKMRLGMTQGFLMVRCEAFGGTLKVLPRVANVVYLGVERR